MHTTAIQMLQLWTDGRRNLKLQKINGATLKEEHTIIDTIIMGDGETNHTGMYLAYRKRFLDYHESGLSAIFINLKKLFPCAKSALPICGRFTREEDGFLKGRSLLETCDLGNHIKIFSQLEHIPTYGIAFEGCKVLDGQNGCLPIWFHTAITCFLPQSCLFI